jgi:hypothetical protein
LSTPRSAKHCVAHIAVWTNEQLVAASPNTFSACADTVISVLAAHPWVEIGPISLCPTIHGLSQPADVRFCSACQCRNTRQVHPRQGCGTSRLRYQLMIRICFIFRDTKREWRSGALACIGCAGAMVHWLALVVQAQGCTGDCVRLLSVAPFHMWLTFALKRHAHCKDRYVNPVTAQSTTAPQPCAVGAQRGPAGLSRLEPHQVRGRVR